MAEFAYRNQLTRALRPTFRFSHPEPDAFSAPPLSQTPLVAMGGGKDSIVSTELMRPYAPVLFAVNPNTVIRSVCDAAGLPTLFVQRRLDPRLFELNAAGAYNGHIPVTAINSLLALATSALHGLGHVVMSNERSASAGNLNWQNIDVNHQWSKGLAAERALSDAVASTMGRESGYFSLLRPLSELHIAKLFARSTRYDHAFTSCNIVFRLRDAANTWCGNCPKCRFVFLALAPFVDRDRLSTIIGADMLEDFTQLSGYQELMGLVRHKPFECVGETTESLVALRLLRQSREWARSAIIEALAGEVPREDWPTEQDVAAVFTPSPDHHVPAIYQHVIAGPGMNYAHR